jgi:arginyl-tRNA synthetase
VVQCQGAWGRQGRGRHPSNGQPGYFVSDIAYHYNKFRQRGFQWVIDVWGADHQGHVPRMKAMMQALGLDPDRLTLYIYQMVTVLERGEQVRLSKRAGTQVDLREVLDDIGPDALRFSCWPAPQTARWTWTSTWRGRNRTRTRCTMSSTGMPASPASCATQRSRATATGADVGLLVHPSELALIRKMLELPEVVELAADNLAHITCRTMPRTWLPVSTPSTATAGLSALTRRTQS